jgi:hypothetical protein
VQRKLKMLDVAARLQADWDRHLATTHAAKAS